jgi:hypothetical protein
MDEEDFDINTYVYPTQDIDYSSGGYDSDFNYGAPGGGDVGVILNPDGTLSGGSGIGAVTGTSAPDSSVVKALKNFLSGKSSLGTYAGTAVGLLGLLDALQKNKQRNANQVTQTPINMNKYTFAPGTGNKPAPRAYGAGAMGQQYGSPVFAAEGGLMGLASGGATNYLSGKTDGMADKLDTSIDGVQPAKLSHGEFVVPADVVSHLGNGNSDAGADVLYKMLDRVRQARTGNKKQGKKIDPNKFMFGGLANLNNYSEGGQVAFETGGAAKVTAPGTVSSSLSPWVQPYVGSMLEKGAALSNKPYEAYGGQLTAGTSPLQQQAFNAASNLSMPVSVGQGANMISSVGDKLGDLKYDPTKFNVDQFNTANVQQYMNPYLQMSLEPQLEEARRQSQITQMQNAAKATQAGAFGGSRGFLMDTETQRNLGQNLANITGQGYNTAFNNATDMFNKQQGLGLQAQQGTEQSKQFGANLGLSGLQGQLNAGTALGNLGLQQNQAGLANLNAQLGAGATQSAIEQSALDAERSQFQEAQLYPYKQLQFQQSLLTGLPISSQTATDNGSLFSDLAAGIGAILNTQKAVDTAVKPG